MTTLANLRKILAPVNGASFISLDTSTTPTLLGGKANPMQGRIKKHNHGANIMVFQNKNSNAYTNMVNRRLLKEGKNPDNFTLSPRRWGTRVPTLPLVEHKGAYYLEVIFLKSGKTSYTLDNKAIQEDKITGLNNPPNGKQGGLNDKVIIRTFKMNSITRISIGGIEYNQEQLQQ